jgi:hypothetical protein
VPRIHVPRRRPQSVATCLAPEVSGIAKRQAWISDRTLTSAPRDVGLSQGRTSGPEATFDLLDPLPLPGVSPCNLIDPLAPGVPTSEDIWLDLFSSGTGLNLRHDPISSRLSARTP